MSDTEEMQEKVAAAFCEPAHRYRWPLALIDSYCGQCWERAAAVLPLIAREKAEALTEFADATRMPFVVFRREDGSPVYVGELMRETADRIEKGADQ